MAIKKKSTVAGAESAGAVAAAVAEWPAAAHAPDRAATRRAAAEVRWPQAGAADSLARRYGMDEYGLSLRREFVRLGDEERELLGSMVPWIQSRAAEMAKEFYDWQFEFGPTREFFENYARQKSMPLASLRAHLEQAQTGYLIEVFAGAEINWDVRYIEKRLQVARMHDKINLPFKWYVGSYTEFQKIVGEHLRRDIRDEKQVRRVEDAVARVFNLDLQVIGDSFILATLDGILAGTGMSLDAVTQSGDRAEQVGAIKEYLTSGLKKFISAMKHMADEHNAGDIDVVIPADQFEGAYREMANGVNGMVAGHIGVKRKAMACIAEFGKGNFEAPLEKFPGKKAFINDTIEKLRANVLSFIAAMKHMSDEHNAGDIDVVIPADQFEGAYREMANGVNGMVLGHIGVKRKAMACIAEFGKGNFEAPLEKFPGKKAFINDTVEKVRANLLGFIADMKRMSEEHNRGDIDVVIPPEKFEGDFQTMARGVNEMVLGHISVKKKAMACIAEFGKGNLDAPLEKFPGKKAFINDTIEQVRGNLKGLLKDVAQNSAALASSAEELTAVSQQMAGNAEETATQANVVSAASEQVSRNVSTVASGAEQMQASIREIAKNSNEAARVAKNAVNVAHSTNDTVAKLGESSQEIGNVIKVITSIAQQTNLLALNATIEAARAGEAGKGFAVVANEVKELAKQTAKATEDIGRKIEAIQSDTKGAVHAIGEITGIINQINDISNSIASAVEEQSVTTNEIGRNVAEAAKGTGDIAKNISGVALAATNTTQGANDTQKAAQELSRMAAQLQSAVGKFNF